MQIQSINEYVRDIKRAWDWYEDIGISPNGTRLEKIHDFIVYRLQDAETPEAKALKAGKGDQNTYYALSDARGFGMIAAEISKLPSHLLPRSTLRDIIKGPLVASEEKVGITTDARNKFIELELAAHFSDSGFKLLGFDDLKFEFEDHRYLVECKRPYYETTLDDNIKKAYKQLQMKLDGPSSHGIVAVAVEKVFGLDLQIEEVETLYSISALSLSIAQQFRDRVAKYENKWVDTRVVGILAIIRFMRRVRTEGLVISNYTPALVKRASAESKRLDRMIKALQIRFSQT